MVCVVMSTYNGEKYIKEQIESILGQVDVDLCLIIRDDASTDSTCNIVREYIYNYPEKIELLTGENLGFALSFSNALKYAVNKYPNCDYFAFSDQDDIWLNNKLSVAVDLLKGENNSIPVTYCGNKTLVDENLHILNECWNINDVKLSKECSMVQNFATGCTMVFNRFAAEMYVEHVPYLLKKHDHLMYEQCMFLGKVIYDHNSYILYRQHGSNQIGCPNFISRMKQRLKGHYKERELEQQNLHFLKSYRYLLSIEDIGLLSSFVFYRKNIFTKLSLLSNKKIRYTSFEYNLFYFLKVILGCV